MTWRKIIDAALRELGVIASGEVMQIADNFPGLPETETRAELDAVCRHRGLHG